MLMDFWSGSALARRSRSLAAALSFVLAVTLLTVNPMSGVAVAAAAAAQPATQPVFAYYYLWWSKNHWVDMLGPSYPVNATPLRLPATLDAAGCNPTTTYAGNKLTDVPSRLYSQDDPGFIEADVRQAAAAGLTGFAVNWAGNGSANQTASDTVYSRRLQVLVNAVHKVNAEGIPFKLWLSYKASAKILSTSWILGDLAYFLRTYGQDSAFDRSLSSKPTIIWQGSRKYDVSVLRTVNDQYRKSLRILGDEKIWTTSRAAFLDGDAYYWSSQNPWGNPQSFAQLAELAKTVRASGKNTDGTNKIWVAPAAPGYNSQLAGGTSCVPRRGGETLRALFSGNVQSTPDAWGLISWNEITEGTYIDPMTRYGTQYLNVLKDVIVNGP